MDRQCTVAGLDDHKDSIYLCVMSYEGVIILQTYSQQASAKLRNKIVKLYYGRREVYFLSRSCPFLKWVDSVW